MSKGKYDALSLFKSTRKREVYVQDNNGRYATIYINEEEFSHCDFNLKCSTYTLDDWNFLRSLSNYVIDISEKDEKPEEKTKEEKLLEALGWALDSYGRNSSVLYEDALKVYKEFVE